VVSPDLAVAEQVKPLEGEPAGDAAIDDEGVGAAGIGRDPGEPAGQPIRGQVPEPGGDAEPEALEGSREKEAVVADRLVERQEHEPRFRGPDRPSTIVGDDLPPPHGVEGLPPRLHAECVVGSDGVAMADLEHGRQVPRPSGETVPMAVGLGVMPSDDARADEGEPRRRLERLDGLGRTVSPPLEGDRDHAARAQELEQVSVERFLESEEDRDGDVEGEAAASEGVADESEGRAVGRGGVQVEGVEGTTGRRGRHRAEDAEDPGEFACLDRGPRPVRVSGVGIDDAAGRPDAVEILLDESHAALERSDVAPQEDGPAGERHGSPGDLPGDPIERFDTRGLVSVDASQRGENRASIRRAEIGDDAGRRG